MPSPSHLARAPWVDRLIHFVVEPPKCRWNGVIHQAEEQSCQPLTVKLCTCHTIGAHLVDPPFIPSSGYLVLPLCRQYFDPQMGLGHVGLQQQPLIVLGWPVPMVIRELPPTKVAGARRACSARPSGLLSCVGSTPGTIIDGADLCMAPAPLSPSSMAAIRPGERSQI